MMIWVGPPPPSAPPGVCAYASLTNRLMLASLDSWKPRTWGPAAKGPALCHRRSRTPGLCEDLLRELLEAALRDRQADLTHQLQVKMHVVHGRQSHAQDFVAAVQMTQVGARGPPAGLTTAGRVDRPGIALMDGITDIDRSGRGEQVSVARMSCRHHAVEHIHAA